MWYILQSPIGLQATIVLTHFLWQAAAIYCLWRLATWVFPMSSPRHRYLMALAAMGAMIVCPLPTIALTSSSVQEFESSRYALIQEVPHASADATESASPAAASELATTDVSSIAVNRKMPAVPQKSSNHVFLTTLQPYALLIWFVGVSLMAARLAAGYVGSLLLRYRGLRSIDPPLRQTVARLAEKVGMAVVPAVHFSTRVSEAMAIGLLRPMILLPAAWSTELTPDLLQAVLAHELAHIQRRDLWVNLLQRFAETLFFYHPAVWWISCEVRRERELCCDEIAILATGGRLAYAQSLESVARLQVAGASPLLSASMLGSRNMSLLARIEQILGVPDRRRAVWPSGIGLAGVAILIWLMLGSLVTSASDVAVGDEPRRDPDVWEEVWSNYLESRNQRPPVPHGPASPEMKPPHRLGPPGPHKRPPHGLEPPPHDRPPHRIAPPPHHPLHDPPMGSPGPPHGLEPPPHDRPPHRIAPPPHHPPRRPPVDLKEMDEMDADDKVLLHEIRELHHEVRMLREQLETLKGRHPVEHPAPNPADRHRPSIPVDGPKDHPRDKD